MAIITAEELREYLASQNILVTEVIPVSGGSSNFVWRITTLAGESRIVKHAEPFLAGNREIPFPVDRMDLEVHALTTLPGIIPHDETIRLPRLLEYDSKNHVLSLENVGQNSLKDVYENPRLDVEFIGESTGRWLARLHASTTSDEVKLKYQNPTARRMYRWNYNSLASVLEKYGFDPSLGERINAKYGAKLETDKLCLCHGDMWPGNVLLPDMSQDTAPRKPRFTVIDWEVARLGNGVTDVGHFAGESWFLDRLRGGRGLLRAFLAAYIGERPLGKDDRERVIAQFGTHITFWPSIYKWIAEKDKIGCIAYGRAILEKVDEGDWDWFKNSELAVLVTEQP